MARRLDVEHLRKGRRCCGALALSTDIRKNLNLTQVTECFCNGSEVPPSQFDPQWNVLEKLNF